MKTKQLWIGLAVLLLSFCLNSSAAVHVRGYTKKDGTYVQPHERSAPNHTKADNWSTKGNVNPYTGKPGTKNPYPGSPSGASTPASDGSSAAASTRFPESSNPAVASDRSEKHSAASSSPNQTKAAPPSSGTQSLEMHYDKSDPILEFQKQNAAKGAPDSQYAIGMRYLNGNGVEKDESKAKEWLGKAASQGNVKAADKLRELEKKPKMPR